MKAMDLRRKQVKYRLLVQSANVLECHSKLGLPSTQEQAVDSRLSIGVIDIAPMNPYQPLPGHILSYDNIPM